MSWRNHVKIRDAIADKKAGGASGSPDPKLMYWRELAYMYYSYGQSAPLVFAPEIPLATYRTDCTFERQSVLDVFYQHTAYSSVTLTGDMYYCGCYDTMEIGRLSYPPVAIWYVTAATFITPSPSTFKGGMIHIITKNGWNIEGVSYPSIKATIAHAGN